MSTHEPWTKLDMSRVGANSETKHLVRNPRSTHKLLIRVARADAPQHWTCPVLSTVGEDETRLDAHHLEPARDGSGFVVWSCPTCRRIFLGQDDHAAQLAAQDAAANPKATATEPDPTAEPNREDAMTDQTREGRP
jgi:hypothetical protein